MSRKHYTPEQIIGMLREAELAWRRMRRLARSAVGLEYRNRVTTAGVVNMVA